MKVQYSVSVLCPQIHEKTEIMKKIQCPVSLSELFFAENSHLLLLETALVRVVSLKQAVKIK